MLCIIWYFLTLLTLSSSSSGGHIINHWCRHIFQDQIMEPGITWCSLSRTGRCFDFYNRIIAYFHLNRNNYPTYQRPCLLHVSFFEVFTCYHWYQLVQRLHRGYTCSWFQIQCFIFCLFKILSSWYTEFEINQSRFIIYTTVSTSYSC